MRYPPVRYPATPTFDDETVLVAGASTSGEPYAAYTHPRMGNVTRLVMPRQIDGSELIAEMGEAWSHGRRCDCCPRLIPPPANDHGDAAEDEPA